VVPAAVSVMVVDYFGCGGSWGEAMEPHLALLSRSIAVIYM